MGYANHIGRVGGLAIALGVGMAVGATPGVAWADTTDGGNAPAVDSAPAAPRGAAKAARAAHDGPSAARSSKSSAPTRVKVRNNKAPSLPTNDGPKFTPVIGGNDYTPVVPAGGPTFVADAPAPAAAGAPFAAATSVPVVAVANNSTPPAAAVALPAPVKNAITGIATKAVKSAVTQLVSSLLGGGQGQSTSLWGALALVRKELGKIGALKAPTASVTSSAVGATSANLLFNPGAELGDPSPSGFTAATVPGWTLTGTPTVISYGGPRTIWSVGQPFAFPNLPGRLGFPVAKVGPKASDGTLTGGNQFFGGGPVADSTISQKVDLAAASAAIDAGTVNYNLGGWLGGYTLDPSAASVKVTFLDATGKSLGEAKLKEVGLFKRMFSTKLLEQTATGLLPKGTRSANVEVIFTNKNPIKYGLNAKYNDAFADNLSFTVEAALPAPVALPPVANPTMVGSLDHVFITYVENKGYNDIVGSANAPFLNGLINDAKAGKTANFAANYFALTHGSLPNYYPMNGATNYGITYNCDKVCIDDTPASVKTLLKSLNASGKNWKNYASGLSVGQDTTVAGGDYTLDSSPFQAFKTVGGDKAYSNAHIVVTTELPVDLKSGATTPSYVWLGTDENNNGEGPVSGVSGALKFVLNQFDPKHQYNVPALDKFLSDNYATITSSDMWKGPDRSAIFITFDEDNNNTYLGFSKDANHIVTVVVPNQAAIDAGMKVGVVSNVQYDHYSLVRTIEEALNGGDAVTRKSLVSTYGYLTKNDEWATPMNDFWNSPV